jgi:hypothetical protein
VNDLLVSNDFKLATCSWRWDVDKTKLSKSSAAEIKSVKLQSVITRARELGYEYIWIDICTVPQFPEREEDILSHVVASRLLYEKCPVIIGDLTHDLFGDGSMFVPTVEYMSRLWTNAEMSAMLANPNVSILTFIFIKQWSVPVITYIDMLLRDDVNDFFSVFEKVDGYSEDFYQGGFYSLFYRFDSLEVYERRLEYIKDTVYTTFGTPACVLNVLKKRSWLRMDAHLPLDVRNSLQDNSRTYLEQKYQSKHIQKYFDSYGPSLYCSETQKPFRDEFYMQYTSHIDRFESNNCKQTEALSTYVRHIEDWGEFRDAPWEFEVPGVLKVPQYRQDGMDRLFKEMRLHYYDILLIAYEFVRHHLLPKYGGFVLKKILFNTVCYKEVLRATKRLDPHFFYEEHEEEDAPSQHKVLQCKVPSDVELVKEMMQGNRKMIFPAVFPRDRQSAFLPPQVPLRHDAIFQYRPQMVSSLMSVLYVNSSASRVGFKLPYDGFDWEIKVVSEDSHVDLRVTRTCLDFKDALHLYKAKLGTAYGTTALDPNGYCDEYEIDLKEELIFSIEVEPLDRVVLVLERFEGDRFPQLVKLIYDYFGRRSMVFTINQSAGPSKKKETFLKGMIRKWTASRLAKYQDCRTIPQQWKLLEKILKSGGFQLSNKWWKLEQRAYKDRASDDQSSY